MIRVLLDTNVVLDALLDREFWNGDARSIWEAHQNGRLAVHITATPLTDNFYIARRHAGRDQARQAILACVDQLHIVSVGINEIQAAVALGGQDFEDDLQMASASAANLAAIVTRDASGFEAGGVDVVTPSEILRRMANPT